MKRITVPVPSAPVLIGLVFALLAALFTGSFVSWAATPANVQADPSTVITGCVGSSNPGDSSLNLGGRTITASTLVRIDPSGTCAANEAAVNLSAGESSSTFNHTIVVTATDDNIDNGARLLSAMTTISNAIPTAQHPYMLKLEPGSYDLDGNSLNLVRFMTLEGSGESKTNIISAIASNSTPTSGIINLTSDTLVKDLSVLGISDGNSNYVMCLYANYSAGPNSELSATVIDHVTVLPILGGKIETYGLYAGTTTNIKIQDSSILAELNGTPNSNVYGIDSHGMLKIQNSQVSGYVANTNLGTNKVYGLRATEGTVTIEQSTLTAFNGTASNHALDVSGNTTVSIKTSTLNANSVQANTNTALYNTSSVAVTFENGTLTTSSTNGGAANNAFENSGTLKIGASQVGGTVSNSGALKCAATYNADFDELGSDCSTA
jgi:hypothetical protein